MDAKFRHMMGRLKSVFGNQSQSHATQINIGMLCCVHLGVEWFRAEIVQVSFKPVLFTVRLLSLHKLYFLKGFSLMWSVEAIHHLEQQFFLQVLLNGLILVQLVDFGNYQHVTMTQIYPLEGKVYFFVNVFCYRNRNFTFYTSPLVVLRSFSLCFLLP